MIRLTWNATGKAVRLAAKSALAGTPAYMAPEVIQANLSHCMRARFSAFNGKKVGQCSRTTIALFQETIYVKYMTGQLT